MAERDDLAAGSQPRRFLSTDISRQRGSGSIRAEIYADRFYRGKVHVVNTPVQNNRGEAEIEP